MSPSAKPKIQVFFDEKWLDIELKRADEKSLLHSPKYEILSGNITQWFECPDRVRNIKSHLEEFPDEFPIATNTKDFGIEPILAIHDSDYINLLKARVKGGGNPEAGVVPEMMLHKNLLPNGFKPDTMHSIGKVGMYHFDLSSTVTADTWTSAYAAVQTALTATETTLANEPSSTGIAATFALIRPPGHHATTNLCGGYCYLNNAIISASHALRHKSNLKCVIIDIDFHHGNGVEEILDRQTTATADSWRDRCKYISLHAHPEYPYYTTHLPNGLPKSVTAEEYVSILRRNLVETVAWCGEENLVLVSLGLDTFSSDPIGGFAGFTKMEEYRRVGEVIGNFVGEIKGNTAFLLEGGYVVEKLGECIEAVFRGYMQGFQIH